MQLIREAEVVVTHGGYGSIFDCLEQRKTAVVVPRERNMKESSDAGLGQIELVRYLEQRRRILALYDLSRLDDVLEEAHRFKPNFSYLNDVAVEVSRILAEEERVTRKSQGINIYRNMLPLFLKHRLLEMTVFVTDKCNFTCKHCFMVDQLNKKKNPFLSVHEYQSMGKHIRSLQRVHIGGGEPLLRNDIAAIVLTISNLWNTQVICLPTNGSIRKNAEATAEAFGREGSHHLRFHFSLSVLGENMDEFTGQLHAFQAWEKTVQSVKRITRALKNVTLVVLSTFNDFNQQQINRFVQYVQEEVVPDDFSFALVRSHDRYTPVLDLETFAAVNHQIHCEPGTHNPFLRAYREHIRTKMTEYYAKPAFKVPCTSGQLRVVMSPDGDVYPCEKLGYPEGPESEKWKMGNIRDFEYNIHRLLKSSQAKAIREQIRTNRCHCQQSIDMSINYLCTWRFKSEVLLLGLKYLFTGSDRSPGVSTLPGRGVPS